MDMNGCFLKFYVAENRRHHHLLAYEWLLEEAKKFGLHGGSAFRAVAGFGRHGRLMKSISWNWPATCRWKWASWSPGTRPTVSSPTSRPRGSTCSICGCR